MKKHQIWIIVWLCTVIVHNLSAQSSATTSLNKPLQKTLRKEWSIHFVAGGIGALAYQTDIGTSLNYQQNKSWSDLMTVSGGAEWAFFVKPYFSIRTGLEVASYKNTWSGTDDAEVFKEDIPAFDMGGNPLNINTAIKNAFDHYQETHKVWFLQVPLMAQIHLLHEKPLGFYLAAGIKPAMGLANSYSSSVMGNRMLKVDDLSQEINNIGHRTGPFEYFKEGKMKLNLNLTLSGEAGLKYGFTPNISMYLGLYADYGCLNIASQQNQPIVPYNTDNVNSVLNSQYILGGVKTFAAGVKLRLAFGTATPKTSQNHLTHKLSYVRVIIRDANTNTPLPTTLNMEKSSSLNNFFNVAVIDGLIGGYRIYLSKSNEDYNVTFNVTLPDSIDKRKFISPTLLQDSLPTNENKTQNDNASVNVVLLDEATGLPLFTRVRHFIDDNMIKSFNTINTNGMYSVSVDPGSFHRLIFNVPIPKKSQPRKNKNEKNKKQKSKKNNSIE